MLTLSMSIPLPKRSVEHRIRLLKVLKAWYLDNLHKGAQKDLMVHWSFRIVYVMATAQREGH